LNPDVLLDAGFVATLATHAERSRPLGTLCGKLLRLGADGAPVTPRRIDSAGIEFTRSFRHLDRGSEEPDDGRYAALEPVFGATAAAALYRRDMIDDVAIEGEFFDEAFFAYREDADVAWRAQLLGWDCLYVPSALGYHVRRVLPERRGALPPMLNRHSVKNRFLMRVKNADGAVWRRCAVAGTTRDVAVVAGCLAWEWSSLPAFAELWRLLPRARRQRALIQQRRRRDGATIARWFR
jgi:GT2 family glycosyltransferase